MTISPHGYTDDFGPNVSKILTGGTRVIRGKVPAQVRKELSAAVKAKVLGHLKKNGLMPEIFFHPDRKNSALDLQKREASYSVSCIASVVANPAQVRAGLEAQGVDVLQYALAEASA